MNRFWACQFRTIHMIVILSIIIVTIYALFSPNWRDLILSDNYYMSNFAENITTTECIVMNDDFFFTPQISNELQFVIPRHMGIVRYRCSYNDGLNYQLIDNEILSDGDVMIKLNWSAKMKFIRNNSDNYNLFMQMNESDNFCSLWSSEKPVSDTIVLILIIITSIFDVVILLVVMIDCDIRDIFKMSSLTFLVQFSFVPVLFFSSAIILYGYCNKHAADAANYVVRQLISSGISSRCVTNVSVTVGTAFYVACVALLIHWILNFGTVCYWKWLQFLF